MTPALHALEPVTDPLALYRLRDGLMAVDLLAAAVCHLDLFTWLADHPSTLGAICAHFGMAPRPADVLLTLCAALGLTTQAGGVVHLTLRAREHLTRGSEFSLRPYYETLGSRPQTLEFLEVLRTGRPAGWASAQKDAWAEAMEGEAFANQFTAAMDCRGLLLAPALARVLEQREGEVFSEIRQLLDVGGGSGIYACAMMSAFPHLQGAVYERVPVDEIARRAIAKRGYGDRVRVIAGDMFEGDWPEGFDGMLLSNVLHDWEEERVQQLLRKAAKALPRGGVLVVHDAFLNAEKTGPLPVAQYSALLMHSTEGRCYSIGELQSWFEQAGLEWLGHHATAVDRGCVLARKA